MSEFKRQRTDEYEKTYSLPCCRCTKGNCSGCACAVKGEKCQSCKSPNCINSKSASWFSSKNGHSQQPSQHSHRYGPTQAQRLGKRKAGASDSFVYTMPPAEGLAGKAMKSEPHTASTSGSTKTPSVVQTESQIWREKGNKVFREDSENLSFSNRKTKLEQANMCYHHALDKANTSDDQASAAKNVAVVTAHLSALYREKTGGFNHQDQQIIKKHMYTALKHYGISLEKGKNKPYMWISGLMDKAASCLEEASEWLGRFEAPFRLRCLEEMTELLPEGALKARSFLSLSSLLLNLAIEAVSMRSFMEAIRFLKEANFPLEEARRMGREVAWIQTRVEEQDAYIFKYLCVAESLQRRAMGESILEDLLMQQEELDGERVWEVIDLLRQAVTLTREREVELEALLMSRLGHVYDKVLIMKERAKDCHMRATQLAHTVYPRKCTREDWFKESQDFLAVYQAERQRELDEKESKEKEEVKKTIRVDLDKLQEHRYNEVGELLEFVYKTWPPKNKAHSLPATSLSEKKRLQKAITHYHPDKQMEHGKQWKVLAEEIVKVLTNRYETYKC